MSAGILPSLRVVVLCSARLAVLGIAGFLFRLQATASRQLPLLAVQPKLKHASAP